MKRTKIEYRKEKSPFSTDNEIYSQGKRHLKSKEKFTATTKHGDRACALQRMAVVSKETEKRRNYQLPKIKGPI
jgi:hypothetical protein